ncbi:hypothetical protein ABH920_008735 [Catenulispora sp. EB89]|uniref:hypothetical protein n=1 Tax=Catenulispora sp. EB89 TaxID=3156257 RepID=UPI003519CEED
MSIFQRLFGSSSTGQAGASAQQDKQACPLCGSSRLLTAQRESRAEFQVDAERSIAVDITVTQINCSSCGKLINDDVNGATAVAYEKLAKAAGAQPPQISAMVRAVMQQAKRLPALSDSDRQQDYDQVRQSWDCLGMHYVHSDKLQDAVTAIIRGYVAEGHTKLQVETLEQNMVQLSFLKSRSFRPVRLSRTSDGGFSFYGQVPLYRYLADMKSTPNAVSSSSTKTFVLFVSVGDEESRRTVSEELANQLIQATKAQALGVLRRRFGGDGWCSEISIYATLQGPTATFKLTVNIPPGATVADMTNAVMAEFESGWEAAAHRLLK